MNVYIVEEVEQNHSRFIVGIFKTELGAITRVKQCIRNYKSKFVTSKDYKIIKDKKALFWQRNYKAMDHDFYISDGYYCITIRTLQ